jgi:hypothetical protein
LILGVIAVENLTRQHGSLRAGRLTGAVVLITYAVVTGALGTMLVTRRDIT